LKNKGGNEGEVEKFWVKEAKTNKGRGENKKKKKKERTKEERGKNNKTERERLFFKPERERTKTEKKRKKTGGVTGVTKVNRGKAIANCHLPLRSHHCEPPRIAAAPRSHYREG